MGENFILEYFTETLNDIKERTLNMIKKDSKTRDILCRETRSFVASLMLATAHNALIAFEETMVETMKVLVSEIIQLKMMIDFANRGVIRPKPGAPSINELEYELKSREKMLSEIIKQMREAQIKVFDELDKAVRELLDEADRVCRETLLEGSP